MTHLGNRQGLAGVLLCPEEVEEGGCLSLPEITVAASGEQKHHRFGCRFQRTNTGPNKIPLSSSLNAAHSTDIYRCLTGSTFCRNASVIETTRRNLSVNM